MFHRGFGVYSKFAYGDVPDPLKAYREKDCVERFIDHIKAEAKRLAQLVSRAAHASPDRGVEEEHEEASTCHICMKPFDNPEKNWKVRDHCHYTLDCTEVLHTTTAISSTRSPNTYPLFS